MLPLRNPRLLLLSQLLLPLRNPRLLLLSQLLLLLSQLVLPLRNPRLLLLSQLLLPLRNPRLLLLSQLLLLLSQPLLLLSQLLLPLQRRSTLSQLLLQMASGLRRNPTGIRLAAAHVMVISLSFLFLVRNAAETATQHRNKTGRRARKNDRASQSHTLSL